jgi:hypothetical protein
MFTLALHRIAAPIGVLLLTGSVAAAQQTTTSNPAKPAKPATKHGTSKPESEAAAPARPAKPALKQGASKPESEAAVVDAHPVLLGQYGEWGAYVARSGGSKICFAIAKPSSVQTTPARKPRDTVFFFVSSRPAESVRNEVSVRIGYALIDATVNIGPTKFAMYTQSDGAWIKNPAEEARLVETMRKGGDLVVTGTSSRTQSVDHYPLKGLSQALDRTAQECK